MPAVQSVSFLAQLATVPTGVELSLTAVRDSVISFAEADMLLYRLKDQGTSHQTPFFGEASSVAAALKNPTRRTGNQVAGGLSKAAAKWNDLGGRQRLDVQIAAAQTLGAIAAIGVDWGKDFGVIKPDKTGTEKFHDRGASLVGAVNSQGPLGMVALIKLLAEGFSRDPLSFRIFLNDELLYQAAERETDPLKRAQLYFTSALVLSPEWNVGPDGVKNNGDDVNFNAISARLMRAAEYLYAAGRRDDGNLYLNDVIGLRRAAVCLSSDAKTGDRLALLQEALAEGEQLRADGERSAEIALKISALYLLDAASNLLNAGSDDEVRMRAQFDFEKAVDLLRKARVLQ